MRRKKIAEKYNKTWQEELCRQIFKEDITPCKDFDEALRYAAADVPEAITSTVIRRYMHGMSMEKIAEEDGIVPETVTNRIRIFIAYMRRAYRPELLRYGLSHWIEKKKTYASLPLEEKRNLTLEDFEFSHRTYSVLRRAGIKTVGDIIDYGNLNKIHMFGVGGYKCAKTEQSCEQTGPDGLIRKNVPQKVWIFVLRKMADIKSYMVVVMSEYGRHNLMNRGI